MYERGDSISDIAKAVNHGEKGIYNKVCLMGYERKVFDKHDVRMAAIYKDKDWCFDRYINQQKTFDEMATEAHCSKRVIQKWCADVYGYNMHTYRHYAKLKPTEREIVMAGRLGDGHITKGDQPLYTETHAEDQKNYLFWKFSKLPTICSTLPKYTPAKIKTLNGKDYLCQASYRLSSRVLDELAEIRDMPKLNIINLLSGLGISLYFLDDGYRDNSNWSLCTGVLTDEEVERLIFILKNKFGITMWRNKDPRYAIVDTPSSKLLDDLILQNLPHNLDIIQHKIPWAYQENTEVLAS